MKVLIGQTADRHNAAEIARFPSGISVYRWWIVNRECKDLHLIRLDVRRENGLDVLCDVDLVLEEGVLTIWGMLQFYSEKAGTGAGELRWFLRQIGIRPLVKRALNASSRRGVRILNAARPIQGEILSMEQDEIRTMLGEPPSYLLPEPEFVEWVLGNQEAWEPIDLDG